MSSPQFPHPSEPRISAGFPDPDEGLCLGCGHKLTLCGVPFTADVKCINCNKINHFVQSKQPIIISDMDSIVSA